MKALISVFSLLKRVLYFYGPAESEKTDIFCQVSKDVHPTFKNKNGQNHPNQEPRAFKLISIAYSKALTSIFSLKRVSCFYGLAESEKTDIFTKFDGEFNPSFSLRCDQNHPNPRPAKHRSDAYRTTLVPNEK